MNRPGLSEGGAGPVPERQVREQLSRILLCPLFSQTTRHRRLLEYLVTETLAGRGGSLKETVVALAVFDKPSSFDAQSDATVRVEVGRLRARLKTYYSTEGSNDPVLIDIPPGHYGPVFTMKTEPAPPQSRLAYLRQLPVAISAGILAVLALAAVVIVYGVGAYRQKQSEEGPLGSDSRQVAVMVVPFSDSAAQGGSSIGMEITDQVINLLQTIPHMRVASRTLAFRSKEGSSDIRNIARELGADLALEGSVTRDAGLVSVTMQLVDAQNGYQVYSDAYRLEADRPQLAREIARAIIISLRLHFDGQDHQLADRYRLSQQAYDLYREGLMLQSKHDGESVLASIEKFRSVAVVDPRFAPALAAEAESHVRLAAMHLAPAAPAIRDAGAAAARALELDSDLAEAHSAMGAVASIRSWDWKTAEQHFVRAIQLQPRIAGLRLNYAYFVLIPQGRFDEASEHVEIAKSLAPSTMPPVAASGVVAFFRGDFKTAKSRFQQVLDVDIDNLDLYVALAATQAESKDYDAALKALARGGATDSVRGLAMAASIRARMGEPAEARRALAELHEQAKRRPVPPYDVALVYAALGQDKEALFWLRSAVEEHSPMALYLAFDPRFRTFRSNRDLQALLKSMNLALR